MADLGLRNVSEADLPKINFRAARLLWLRQRPHARRKKIIKYSPPGSSVYSIGK
jgi:hypothetical protein